ncbi:hypothetical protein BCR34DRAFT_483035 [Clohesyomyces aquaticus]|uniref:ABM domain-containing protein n=1 Tax=Clohesyomyces aquaticus TaxID=1231657 RepID=A0A1Y1ZPU7_9PLEO|nr:hypothetical protein BCR34DRAFT_483035 [Clohesyomyces aquaticus]
MPVLEVTQLRLKGVSAADRGLLRNLSLVRDALQTNSRFYHCTEDPSLIYIFGLWPSLDAHLEFLASPRSSEVLGPQEEQLDFQWALHMNLDAMSSLPLDAPVMAISMVVIKEHDIDAYNQSITATRRLFSDASRPYRIVNGWRCDPTSRNHEAVMFTGWPSVEAHSAFVTEGRKNPDFARMEALYQTVEVRHARTLESNGPS